MTKMVGLWNNCSILSKAHRISPQDYGFEILGAFPMPLHLAATTIGKKTVPMFHRIVVHVAGSIWKAEKLQPSLECSQKIQIVQIAVVSLQ